MGSALSRRDYGETVDDMVQRFPYWFNRNFQKWAGRWNDMPVDAHTLIALSAPRPVFLTGGTDDQWADPVGEFQASQFKLADMATELEASRLMIRSAASALDRRDPRATMLCAMAKRFATDTGFKIANDALQLHGGYGYLKDFPAERHVRDLRVHQILEGTNEIMRVIVARELSRQ